MDQEKLCADSGALLSAAGLESLEDLADFFADGLNCGDVIITEESIDGLEITMTEYGRRIGYEFPISLDEIWSDLLDLEDEHWTPLSLDSVRDDIFAVEGFEVKIELDDTLDDDALIDAIGRRTTSSGEVVQYQWTMSFPFDTPMPDEYTVAVWLDQRFHPHCRGCRIEYFGLPSDTLGDLRTGNGYSSAPLRLRGPRRPRSRG